MGKELDKAARLMQTAIQTNTPVFVFDVETEGFDPVKHHIIQLSALKIDPKTFEVLDKINVFINPCRPLSNKVKEITGYTDEFLATCPLEVEVFPEIYNFLGEAPLLIGHCVDFDVNMLDALYTRQGRFLFCESINTCQMARELLKKKKDVPSHKLPDVAAYYGADIGLTFHKANDDIIATLRIFQAMYDPDAYLKPKKKLNINSIWYHDGFQGHARIYINTDAGSLFYDNLDKNYGSKDFSLDDIDMEDLEEKAIRKWSASNIDDLFQKVRAWHWKKMQEAIGRQKEFANEKEAMEAAAKENKRHYNTSIQLADGVYIVTLEKFLKSKAGSNSILY